MNVPATVAALGGEKARWKLAELATEALMVVFAVLVALGVEEWREERQLRAFADRARMAVDLELEQNLDEFRSDGPDLIEIRDLARFGDRWTGSRRSIRVYRPGAAPFRRSQKASLNEEPSREPLSPRRATTRSRLGTT